MQVTVTDEFKLFTNHSHVLLISCQWSFFLYPLKISENQMFFDVFGGFRKKLVEWNGLRKIVEKKMFILFQDLKCLRIYSYVSTDWDGKLLCNISHTMRV